MTTPMSFSLVNSLTTSPSITMLCSASSSLILLLSFVPTIIIFDLSPTTTILLSFSQSQERFSPCLGFPRSCTGHWVWVFINVTIIIHKHFWVSLRPAGREITGFLIPSMGNPYFRSIQPMMSSHASFDICEVYLVLSFSSILSSNGPSLNLE